MEIELDAMGDIGNQYYISRCVPKILHIAQLMDLFTLTGRMMF